MRQYFQIFGLFLIVVLTATTISCGDTAKNVTTTVDATSTTRTTAFSATLDSYDTTVWEKADWANGSMFHCGWSPDNITFADSIMTIKLDNTASHGLPYAGGEYRTLTTFNYGTFETTMKPASASGIVSSFFLYTASPWDEIDIEFLGKNTTQVQFNYYVSGVGGHEKIIDLGFDAAAEYHKYAIKYAAGSISWYIDGTEKWSVSSSGGTTLPNHSMKIMMNVWPGTGVDSWLGTFTYSAPLYAHYDYVTYTP